MPDPRFRPRLAIHRCLLDIYILIRGVKIDCADCCRLTRHGALETDFLEEGGVDEVYILAGNGKQAHDGEEEECSHGSGVVIARKTAVGVVERRWNVLVDSFSRKAWSAGVVVEVHCQEDGFVGNIRQAALVEKVEARNEFIIATYEGDEGRRGVRDIADVLS